MAMGSGLLFIVFLTFIALITPMYGFFRIVDSLNIGSKNKINGEDSNFEKGYIKHIHEAGVMLFSLFGLLSIIADVSAEYPIRIYQYGNKRIDYYAALSSKHMLTIGVYFVLGIVAYYILTFYKDKLSPVLYIVCCAILILNIIFTGFFIAQVIGCNWNYSVPLTIYGFVNLSIIYIAMLIKSLVEFIEKEKTTNRQYKNKFLSLLYRISLKYQTMPFLWIISLFPVLLIIQHILILFGQQPDSFIRAFLETSDFNYSQITPPPPIILDGDGHYLCTVSLKGHKKIVKPVRAGIRYGNRILVNRQLLIANAFENILEEYTPRFHKFIRYIYDKYGLPLSNYIKSSWSADLVYMLMKPLEWIFIVVLYTVDRNPENRINVQYSELRR